MKWRNILVIILGILAGIFYMILANSLKNTESIWILTRLFGLAAFAVLFFLILFGELRLLGDNTGFKFHCPLGILTFYLAFLHFLSAVFDKFKWGKSLNFFDYLGFNFSDKWLTLLSLGALAFYLIILISLTSSNKSIQAFGFKKWKVLHYASYIVFILVFIHSLLLGTDLKTSGLREFIFPIFIFMGSLIVFLFIARLIRKLFEKKDLVFIIVLAVVLALSAAYFFNSLRIYSENLPENLAQNQGIILEIKNLEKTNDYYFNYSNYLTSEIRKHQNNSIYLASRINKTQNPLIEYRYIYVNGGGDDD